MNSAARETTTTARETDFQPADGSSQGRETGRRKRQRRASNDHPEHTHVTAHKLVEEPSAIELARVRCLRWAVGGSHGLIALFGSKADAESFAARCYPMVYDPGLGYERPAQQLTIWDVKGGKP